MSINQENCSIEILPVFMETLTEAEVNLVEGGNPALWAVFGAAVSVVFKDVAEGIGEAAGFLYTKGVAPEMLWS